MAEPPSRGRSAPARRSRRGGAAGFTLIEVMVALAVFSLAALALIRLEGATIRSTAVLGDTIMAQMVARNVAVDAITAPAPPALGRTSGVEQNGGRAWRWAREVRRTGDAQILRIDVAVMDAGGRAVGRLTMIRPPQTTVTTS